MKAWLAIAVAFALAMPADAQTMSRRRKNGQGTAPDIFRLYVGSSSLSGQNGETITFTRASSKYCPQADYSVTVLASNAPCIVGGKVLIENSSTNFLLRSDAIGDTGSWTNTNTTISADAAAAPWSGTTMDTITASTAAGKTTQAVTVSSSVGPFTLSGWGRSVSGTHSAALSLTCTGTTPSACVCKRDDGTTCSTTVSGAECGAVSSFGTTPQRVQVTATCTAAVTSVTAAFGGGDFFGAATGQAHIWGGGQLEVRKFATTYIPTTTASATRAVDVAKVPTTASWPIGTGAMAITFTPLWGGTGLPQGDLSFFGNPYDVFPTNGWILGISNNGRLYNDHRIANVSASLSSTLVATPWEHGTPYLLRYTWNVAGTAAFYKDGVLYSASSTRAANSATSIMTPIQIGGSFNGFVDGWISALCLSTSENGCPSLSASGPVKKFLWLSDSIYNMETMWDELAGYYPGQKVFHTTATYGGQPIGAGLIELSDSTYAYRNSTWELQTRAVPFSDFDALIFEFARNDGGQINTGTAETLTAFRQAYDKLARQGLKYFPKVVSGVCVPKAAGDVSDWDAAGDEYSAGNLNIGATINTVVAKYNLSHVDGYSRFLALKPPWTVANLMRDAYHPTYTFGAVKLAEWVKEKLDDGLTPTLATPELTGDVVTYLWGQPTAGTWALVDALSPVGPFNSPIVRISQLADQGLMTSETGAKVVFPAVEAKQVWVHYFRRTDGGNFTVYIDRGTGQQASRAVTTSHIYHMYPQSYLVSGALGSGTHTIEIETTSSAPVAILGVTVIKA